MRLEADPRTLLLLIDREVRESWRNRWFLLYAAAFAVLALALSWLSLAGAAGTGFAGLGRTAASLLNLVLLVVPLMGLTLGAGAIAPERERGSWLYLLAQPLSRLEVVLGKFLGLLASVLAAVFLGFGIAAFAIGRGTGGEWGAFLGFVLATALLAAAAVSLGLLISAVLTRASTAAGVALFVWLALVLLGDLGLMGTSLAMKLGAQELLTAALVNPLQEFKLAALLELRGSLEVLGPAGLYATRTWGGALGPALWAALALWTIVPLGLTIWTIERRGAL